MSWFMVYVLNGKPYANFPSIPSFNDFMEIEFPFVRLADL